MNLSRDKSGPSGAIWVYRDPSVKMINYRMINLFTKTYYFIEMISLFSKTHDFIKIDKFVDKKGKV